VDKLILKGADYMESFELGLRFIAVPGLRFQPGLRIKSY
jgi:hypothetical protein